MGWFPQLTPVQLGLQVLDHMTVSTYMSHLILTIDAAMINNQLEEVSPRFKERDGMMNMVG